MTREEIKNRIANLLGFNSHTFGSYKTTEGVELKMEGELEINRPIYVITPEGELPAPEGDYELENGMTAKVKEGMLAEIIPSMKIEVEENEDEVEQMASATLADGTKITNKQGDAIPFEVGQVLYVITDEGQEILAPMGQHTTDSGIVLTIAAEDGVITGLKRPDEEGEGSLFEQAEHPDTEMGKDPEMKMVDFVEELMGALEKMTEELKKMKSKQEEMEMKFSKFSAQPAGEKVYERKNLSAVSTLGFSKAEAILKLRQQYQ